MSAITVLDLSNTSIRSLPRSISCLTNLTTLCLNQCNQLTDLSLIGELKRLEVLILGNRNLKVAPKEIGLLVNLRCLDLTSSEMRVKSDVISRLHLLEHLFVPGGILFKRQRDSPTAFAQKTRLRRLTKLFMRLKDKRLLYQEITMVPWETLKEFNIHYWVDDGRSAIRPKMLKHGREMSLWILKPGAGWVMALLRRTLNLKLIKCKAMEYLVGEQGQFPQETFANLESLIIKDASKFCNLCNGPPPDRFLESLGVFEISLCHTITTIFPSDILSGMNRLEELDVLSSYGVEEIFEYDNNSITGESSISMLLPRLKKMVLIDLENMVSIWKGAVPHGCLANLEILKLYGCPNLKYVFPPTMWNLPRLREITIYGCHNLSELFSREQVQGPQLLERIDVTECNNLKYVFPPTMRNLPRLCEISINGCDNLSELFSREQARGLQLLEKITVRRCKQMKSIIMLEVGDEEAEEDQRMLLQLKSIQLKSLPTLNGFYGGSMSLFDWPELEFLVLLGCKELKRLPIGANSAPKLVIMEGDDKEWFDGLEWEDEGIKSRVEAIFHPRVTAV